MIELTRFQADAGRSSFHGHPVWHFCAVLGGEFEEVVGSQAYECGLGAVRVSRPGADHDLRFGPEGADCLIAEVRGEFWSRLFSRQLETAPTAHRFGLVDPEDLLALANTSAAWNENAELRGMEDVGLLFARIARDAHEGSAPSWLEDSHALIMERQGAISLSRLAAVAKVNRGDFARLFRANYGFLPSEFRALLRLQYSLRIMATEKASLAHAAAEAGYANQSHMTRAFQAILGKTPGAVMAAPPS